MKKIYLLVLLLILIFQTKGFNQIIRKVDPVICPADPNTYDTYIGPPKKFQQAMLFGRSANQPTADIVVNYNGFTEEAETAFQYAVDIWASIIKSPVTIRIDANFSDLGNGVLGAAGPNGQIRDFKNAPFDTTYYPMPLAEKLAGENLNNDQPDIVASFSSTFNFYFGLDGNPPSGQYDFVSIVLHELGHGLGFTGAVAVNEDATIGSWDIGTTGKSNVFTKFVQLGTGDLITDLPTEGEEVIDAFTSNNLFFNGPLATSDLGENPKLYAPSTWNGGSSFSHLDEDEFPAGDPNSLMSPQFGAGEAIHDPGVTLDMFADMGWVHTYLRHENENKISTNTTDPFSISLNVTSDTTFNTLAPILVYSTNQFETQDTITLVDSGNGVDFVGGIPNPGSAQSIQYYFSGVEDELDRTYTLPYSYPRDYFEINLLAIPSKALPYTKADGGDFETSLTDFNPIALNGVESLWELGEPGNKLNTAVSGTNVWKTRISENIGDASTSYTSALISPSFDFSDDTKNHLMKFSYAMEIGYTDDIGTFDGGPLGFNVEYSLDGGQSWDVLGKANDIRGNNWYNIQEDIANVFSPDAPFGWIDQTIEVVEEDTVFITRDVTYNVSNLTGNSSVTFRFVFHVSQDFIEQGYQADGVLLDDFEILTGDPTAEFDTESSKLAYSGDEVAFEYLSTGATSYSWDFGDGNTSDLENPVHTYEAGGTYNVALTIGSSAGDKTVAKERFITVIPDRAIPYTIDDGGNLETETGDFNILNISGTGFEKGSSSVEGKQGTASGSIAYVTGLNANEYANNSEAYIYTPEFDFSSLGNYAFSFKTNYQFEDNWDGFIVEYTLDRGQSWLKLNDEVDEDNWYNQTSDPQSVFGNAVPIFSGNTGGEFLTKSTDISFLAGNELVSFRIKFLTDAAVVDAGMAIDDFEIDGPAGGPALPNFAADVQNGCEGTSVVFTNNSTGSIQSLDWDFGEGATPRTASGIGPHTVTYNDVGDYTVTLVAEDFLGSTSSEIKENYVQISANHTPTFSIESLTNEEGSLLTASAGDAYQWFVDGDSIADATSQTYEATATGVYSVAVQVGGCVGFSSNGNVTSISNPVQNSLSAYPNPTNSQSGLTIAFESDYSGAYTVEIINLDGKSILKSKKEKYQRKEVNSLSLPDMKNGFYILRIRAGENIAQQKILIHQ